MSAVYRGYATSGRARRWDSSNPGNRAISDERETAVLALVDALGIPSDRVLDVGCGNADHLAELGDLLESSRMVGIDVQRERLAGARARHPDLPLSVASGGALPIRSESFDTVVLWTVLSSVLDEALAARIAAESARVLRPGGAVLWYDLRHRSPTNRAVRPIKRASLSALFPGMEHHVQPLTVAPPLARRLGSLTTTLYPLLSRIGPLRTHLFGVLRKPNN